MFDASLAAALLGYPASTITNYDSLDGYVLTVRCGLLVHIVEALLEFERLVADIDVFPSEWNEPATPRSL